LTNRQTGELLGISHRTVEVHRARLMRKLDVQSVAQLVALYVLHGQSQAGHGGTPPC
jgi:DNA-binding CsgD family transcriptional regulator